MRSSRRSLTLHFKLLKKGEVSRQLHVTNTERITTSCMVTMRATLLDEGKITS